MAAWFDKLKKLVETTIKIDLSNFTLVNINIGTINKAKKGGAIGNEPFHVDAKNQTLVIDLDQLKLDKTRYKKFQEIVNEDYVPSGNFLLEQESSSLLERLYVFTKNSEYNKHLSFFEGVISDDDYAALEASYFLRKIHDTGGSSHEISSYKADIREEYGQRGGHIANLCTAGYFEELFIPAYNSNEALFKDLYGLVVDRRAMTIFVHAWMKKDEILPKLKRKLEAAKKYGLKMFYIHAKGKTNIKTIHKCLDEYSKKYGSLTKVERDVKELGIVVIQIILK